MGLGRHGPAGDPRPAHRSGLKPFAPKTPTGPLITVRYEQQGVPALEAVTRTATATAGGRWTEPREDNEKRLNWRSLNWRNLGNHKDPIASYGKYSSVSAIAYTFGVRLHRKLGVPVGIIDVSKGGSFGHQWCNREELKKVTHPNIVKGQAEYDEPLIMKVRHSLEERGIEWKRLVRGNTPITAEQIAEADHDIDQKH